MKYIQNVGSDAQVMLRESDEYYDIVSIKGNPEIITSLAQVA
jgi:hypothetical protein